MSDTRTNDELRWLRRRIGDLEAALSHVPVRSPLLAAAAGGTQIIPAILIASVTGAGWSYVSGTGEDTNGIPGAGQEEPGCVVLPNWTPTSPFTSSLIYYHGDWQADDPPRVLRAISIGNDYQASEEQPMPVWGFIVPSIAGEEDVFQIVAPADLRAFPGYDDNKVQFLGHDAAIDVGPPGLPQFIPAQLRWFDEKPC